MTLRMSELRQAHPLYFRRRTKQFFGDLEYRILHNKQHNPYLVRRTKAWTDMFGRTPVQHWRLNPIGPNLEIEGLVAGSFPTLDAAKEWLRIGG